MNIRYWFLLAASVASLTTCTSGADKREEAKQAASTLPPSRVASPDTAALPTAAGADAPATGSVPTPARRAAQAGDTSQPGRSQRPVAAASSWARPADDERRVPTTLADAPDRAEVNEAATGVDSAATAELRQFLLSGLPPTQQFVVRPGRDTMLLCRQGTQVLIPADVWDLGADSSAVVQVAVQEFYTAADMVLAGLSTTSGPRLLETGGMLHLAATANGRPVQLRPGSYVHLRMPAKERQPGMQVFQGLEKGPGHRVDWQLPAGPVPAPAAAAEPPSFKDLPGRRSFQPRKFRARRPDRKKHVRRGEGWMESTEPEYVTGEKGFRKALAATISYPAATRARLRRGRRMSKDERLKLRLASEEYKERILRIVSVDFVVDSTGTISDAEVPATADAELATAIKSALRQLPPWEPAMFSTGGQRDSITPGEAARKVVFYFGESGRIVVAPKDWNLEKTAHQRQSSFQHQYISQLRARYQAERGYTDAQYAARPRYYDSLQQVRAAAELERLRTQFTDTSKAAITQNGMYNELSTQGLRWINCDRYLGPGPLITYGVNTGRTGAVVTLLFRGFKSVMAGEQLTPSRFVFKQVPLGKVVTVLALRRENGITYLSARRSVVGLSALSGFDFHPVTMAELRAELAELN